ncbi:MAG: methyl-accepting chemotaxis protein [Gammaproteobacteria bacterium]|nr:methyl-accepting chemotaxis protein [Gammaproteobacteria bacterium]
MKYSNINKLGKLANIKITQKLIGVVVGLLIGFVIIGLAYQRVLQAEREAVEISEKMVEFERGIHEVQLDLLNARQSETEFYLKKYPIFLGKFDTRIIVASQNLKGLTKLVKGEDKLDVITELGEAFENYRDKFIQAADSQIEIGLDENTGLKSNLANASNVIETVLKKHNLPVLDRSLLRMRQHLSNYVNFEEPRYSELMIKEIGLFRVATENSKLSAPVKLEIRKALANYKSIFLTMSETVSMLAEQKKSVKQSVKTIEPLFSKMVSISNEIISTTREEASVKRNQITTFFISTLVLIAVAASLGLFFLARSIIKPMKVLQDTVLKVNEGDLNVRAGLDRKDELGDLSNALDKLLDEKLASMAQSEKENDKLNESVISLIRAVSQLAQQKDLAVKIPVSEDITGAISDSLNLLAKETAKIMKEAQLTSSEVASVSSLVKKQSDAVISVANTERKEVESTALMLESSVKAMNEIALNSEEANKKAEITSVNTQTALDAVMSSADGIKSIRDTISETEKRIKRLGERSQEISGIVSLINSIAERTHILALNASMHAASAGEAGRGFAVVADEVQRLAENAREATSEISTVVNNIRVETADTVAIMNTVITQVAEGTQLANQASQSMKHTQQATNDLIGSVRHIAKSSEQQVDISKQLLVRARKIKESTEETGRELLEQTRSADKLVRYSEDLVAIVGIFKLPAINSEQDEEAYKTSEIKQAV